MAFLTWIGRGLERSVWPNACVFCGKLRERRQAAICDGCNDDLPWIDNACGRCANPVAAQLPLGVHCAARQQDPPPFTAAVAPLDYSFPVDAAIKALKFRRKLYYVPALSHILNEAIGRLPPDIDGLLPVPLHWRRQALRGFNQATELCRPVQQRTGLKLIVCMKRCHATAYQSGLPAAQRQRNLQGAFSIRGSITARHVLIVDDVITTGETCRQLASTLLAAGVQKVSVLAIARA